MEVPKTEYEIDYASLYDAKNDPVEEMVQDLITVHWQIIDPVKPPTNKIRSWLSDLIKEVLFAKSILEKQDVKEAPMASLFLENPALTFECLNFIYGMNVEEMDHKQIAKKHQTTQLVVTLRIKKLKQVLGLDTTPPARKR